VLGISRNFIVCSEETVTDKKSGQKTEPLIKRVAKYHLEAEPVGQVLAAQTASARMGTAQWPDLPSAFDLFAEFPLCLGDYGSYVVKVDIMDSDGTQHRGPDELLCS
jgi:hypothetical protein